MKQVTAYIDTSPADVIVSQSGVKGMHMTSSSLPLAAVDTVLRIDGISWADPILFETNSLKTRKSRALSYVIGYVPGGRGGPVTIDRGKAPGPGEIVLDERAASKLDVSVGSTVNTLGRTWKVSGFTKGLTNIVNTAAFVRFKDYADARGIPGTASYILVGADGSPAKISRDIEEATGLTALPRALFSREEAKLVRDMSTQIMQIMTIASLLIALAVTALTLYADTLSRLREVGVMKAIGARTRKLGFVVLSQAAWMAGAAIALSIGLAFVLAAVVGRVSANISMEVTATSMVRVAVGAVVVAAIGAVAPLVKVARVDPASIFRRQ
jgi:putative ABC transport system permease protein